MRHYAQLTQHQRYQIEVGIARGCSNKEVAEDVGVHPSTVSRELRRNQSFESLWGYDARSAEHRTLQRRRRPQHQTDARILAEAIRLAEADWSPEQVAGRLRLEHGVTFSATACRSRAAPDARHAHLRHGKPYRQRGAHEKRGRIPNKTPIGARPDAANDRSEVGHWEGDTMIGKGHRGVLVTLTDRNSRLTLAAPAARKTKDAVGARLVEMLAEQRGAGRCRTLTLDNGMEFAGHEAVAEKTRAAVFFADPYASWQRGTNENGNGLLRECFPKQRPLAQVSQAEVKDAVDRLNHRPRKNSAGEPRSRSTTVLECR